MHCVTVVQVHARHAALERLHEVGKHLKSPELAQAWTLWRDDLRGAKARAQMSSYELLQEREATLSATCARLERELARVRTEADARVARVEDEKAKALENQLTALTGSAEQIAALREAEEKEARVELLKRQIGRRMLYGGLARGWAAWHELWEAKTSAMAKLQSCGNKLSKPEIAGAFDFWAADFHKAKQARAMAELEAQSNSLEAQLRQAKCESTHIMMMTRICPSCFGGATCDGFSPCMCILSLDL